MEFILQSKITFHPHVPQFSRVIARLYFSHVVIVVVVAYVCVFYVRVLLVMVVMSLLTFNLAKINKIALFRIAALSRCCLIRSFFIPFFPISIAHTFLSFAYYVILSRRGEGKSENSGFRHHRSYVVVIIIISIIAPCLLLCCVWAKWSKQKIETICKRSGNTILCA